MYWSCLLHIYQPPWQKKEILAKVVKESYLPILKILEKNEKVKITLNICASLTELLVKFGFKNILSKIKKLAQRGQIEFTGSAAYHPILPLLPKTEVVRQIKLNEKINKKYFGKIWRPKGFFLPEMAYDKKTARIIESLDYKWLILDEITYNGKLGEIFFDKFYQLKNSKLKIIFRNRGLSDIFYTGWLNSEKRFWLALKNDKRCGNFLITAFDGENLGHHKLGSEKIFARLVKKVQTLTISELLKIYQKKEIVEPMASSWSSREIDIKQKIDYPLWFHPQNEIQQLQWKLTKFTLQEVEKNKKDLNYKKARNFLDKALNSCQYWWASAAPWWSSEIVINGTENFLRILKTLKKLDNKVKQQTSQIKDKIVLTAENLEESDEIEKRRYEYLKGEPLRYFGGETVK